MSGELAHTHGGGAEQAGMWTNELERHLWAMDPRALASLAHLAHQGRLEAHIKADVDIEAARQRGRPRAISGGVATVPLKGVLAPVSGFLAMLLGLENPLDTFQTAISEAIADPEVGAVVVEIDSPGGVIDGIPEAAKTLRAMKGTKPIVAHANTMAASAAYWLAAQADEVVVAPSGAVGSIGVYATHRDVSGAMEMMGMKNTLISAGKFKTAGNAFEPLSDEAKGFIQEDVDYFYSMFTADVAKGRGVTAAAVRDGYGEGRVLNPKAALAANLVDRVETIGETVARLSSRSRGSVGGSRAEDDAPELEANLEHEAEAESGATDEQEQARRTALEALLIDDPVLASRALDKVAASAAA